MKLPKPTRNNYFSLPMEEMYFSASQVKEFLSCSARAVAKIRGEWSEKPGTALIIGSYVDAAFDGPKTFQKWKADHPEIYKRDGTLKSDYVRADEMVQRARRDSVFMEYMRGRKQTIKTGVIAGVPFKCKFDVYRKGERIVDLKTVKDMKPVYIPGQGRVDFASGWLWPLQLSIYQYIEGNHLPCFLAVITKEEPPEIEIVQIEQERLDTEIAYLKEKLPMFNAMKMGIIEPERCENCAYCRATKKLTGPKMLEELEFDISE